MKFNDIIRSAMKQTGITQVQLGEKLGVRQTAISNTVVRPGTTVSKFVIIMDALGYDVVVKPRKGDGESMVVTAEGEVMK